MINQTVFILTAFLFLPFWVKSEVTEPVSESDSNMTGDFQIDHMEEYDPEESFNTANQLYTEGRYEEAISLYEQITGAGYHSADLYYNLGNAYYRSNKIPSAILNYERAALLDPADEDIQANLELARMHVRDRIEELPDFFLNRWWKNARDLMSTEKWAAISVSTFIATLVFLSVFLLSSSVFVKKTSFWMAVVIFLFSVLGFSFGLDRRNYLKNHNTAIVFSPVVSVKSSPDINSTDLFIIHEGTRVWVEDSLGDWRAVRLSDGNKGWLKADAVKMI
ncbi:MAG: tetratricopeptide repeat protein [Bacteroidales bacterium]